MEIGDLSFGNELFDIDAQIERLQAEQNNQRAKAEQLRHEFENKIAKIKEEFQKAQLELSELQRARIKQLADLREEKKRLDKIKAEQDKMASFNKTANLVHAICKDFESWNAAHPYQVEDVVEIIHAYINGERGFMNANDMGLGKTYETIVALYILSHIFEEENGRKPHILWLTKTAILRTGSTTNELKKWWPDFKIAPLLGSDNKTKRSFVFDLVDRVGMAIITNYETVRTTEEATNIEWDFVVMDEVHKLKGGANPSGPTAIWKAVKDLALKTRFAFMLSGTPMVNRPQEMWSYLHIFDPSRFPDLKHFERAFCDYKTVAGTGQIELTVDPNRILQNALKGRMIRRRRDEVGLQLPELTVIDVELDHNDEQRKVYEKMRTQFFIWLDEMQTEALTAAAVIAQLTRLRQINVWPAGIVLKDAMGGVIGHLDVEDSSKIDEAMDKILEAQDQVVVFSNFNAPMHELARRCKAEGLTCRVISGENSKEMDGIESEFQNRKFDVLCLNSSMGEGLNLQKNPSRYDGGASIGIFLDIWWNPARDEQCIGRIHRQGAHQPVTVYRLLIPNSVDTFMLDKSDAKAKQFHSIMESDEIRPASAWKDFLEGMI